MRFGLASLESLLSSIHQSFSPVLVNRHDYLVNLSVLSAEMPQYVKRVFSGMAHFQRPVETGHPNITWEGGDPAKRGRSVATALVLNISEFITYLFTCSAKPVYHAEEQRGAGSIWHKVCFKCKECKKKYVTRNSMDLLWLPLPLRFWWACQAVWNQAPSAWTVVNGTQATCLCHTCLLGNSTMCYCSVSTRCTLPPLPSSIHLSFFLLRGQLAAVHISARVVMPFVVDTDV